MILLVHRIKRIVDVKVICLLQAGLLLDFLALNSNVLHPHFLESLELLVGSR